MRERKNALETHPMQQNLNGWQNIASECQWVKYWNTTGKQSAVVDATKNDGHFHIFEQWEQL